MTCEQCYVCEQTVLQCSRTMLLAMTYDLCHGGHMVAEYPLLHTPYARWEHVWAHFNVQGNEVANGLAMDGMCSSPLRSKQVQQDLSDLESTVGLRGGSGSESEDTKMLWASPGIVPMDSDEMTREASGEPAPHGTESCNSCSSGSEESRVGYVCTTPTRGRKRPRGEPPTTPRAKRRRGHYLRQQARITATTAPQGTRDEDPHAGYVVTAPRRSERFQNWAPITATTYPQNRDTRPCCAKSPTPSKHNPQVHPNWQILDTQPRAHHGLGQRHHRGSGARVQCGDHVRDDEGHSGPPIQASRLAQGWEPAAHQPQAERR